MPVFVGERVELMLGLDGRLLEGETVDLVVGDAVLLRGAVVLVSGEGWLTRLVREELKEERRLVRLRSLRTPVLLRRLRGLEALAEAGVRGLRAGTPVLIGVVLLGGGDLRWDEGGRELPADAMAEAASVTGIDLGGFVGVVCSSDVVAVTLSAFLGSTFSCS